MTPRHLEWLVAATGIVVIGLACKNSAFMKDSTSIQAPGRPECPGADSLVVTMIDSVGKLRGRPFTYSHEVRKIPLAGDNSNVPEFHDCQRFIVKDSNGMLQYDSLYAIFASFRMQALTDSLAGAIPSPSGFPAAEILSYGGTYPALGIEPNFNCLYFYRVGPEWKAKMVPIGSAERNCGDPLVDPAGATGTDLEVRRSVAGGWDYHDYPDVSRWDWDSTNSRQYISIKCGSGWCEVGAPGFRSSPQHTDSPPIDPVPGGQGTASERSRVFRIKGWYDRQLLAVRDGNGHLRPGKVWGTIIPHPVLGRGDHNTASYFQPWIHVATVFLSGDYDAKYVSFKAGRTKLSLCNGTALVCDVPNTLTACPSQIGSQWWTMVQHVGADGAPDENPIYRCATMRSHSNTIVPGTSRWRWMEQDETSWMRCTQGCCELN